MKLFQTKRFLAITVAILLAFLLSGAYLLSLQNLTTIQSSPLPTQSPPPVQSSTPAPTSTPTVSPSPAQTLPESFGSNLGFESGGSGIPEGWTTGDWVDVVSNPVHSGHGSAFVGLSSKHDTVFYQNWKVNSTREIYLEAYVLVTCLRNGGASYAGIMLRELDSVELYASAGTCRDYILPSDVPRTYDSILARVRINDTYTEWSMKFPLNYSRWYKLGLTSSPGRIAFYVDDQLVHVGNLSVHLSYPSFGGVVRTYSSAYFDDFRMGQRNPSTLAATTQK